jgi:ATP-dependent protease Clp ATPase subunit
MLDFGLDIDDIEWAGRMHAAADLGALSLVDLVRILSEPKRAESSDVGGVFDTFAFSEKSVGVILQVSRVYAKGQGGLCNLLVVVRNLENHE